MNSNNLGIEKGIYTFCVTTVETMNLFLLWACKFACYLALDFYLMFASSILQNVTTEMESGFLTIVDLYTRGLAVNNGFQRAGPAD